MKKYDLGAMINTHKLEFVLAPFLQDKNYQILFDKINAQTWYEFKFIDDSNNYFNEVGIRNVPNNMGGIYFFYIQLPILKENTKYLAYIGRAHISDSQNIRKRIREYFYKYMNDTERPKVFRMLEGWKECLYVKYILLDDNTLIDNVEKGLINSILPPFNNQIPNKNIRDAVKMFK